MLLNGCAEAAVDMPAACTLSESKPSTHDATAKLPGARLFTFQLLHLSFAPGSGKMVQVYFGCGCFWHMQHEFVP